MIFAIRRCAQTLYLLRWYVNSVSLVKQGPSVMQDVETHLCKEIMSEAGSQDEGSVFPLRAECDLRGRCRSEDPKISMSGRAGCGFVVLQDEDCQAMNYDDWVSEGTFISILHVH